MTDDEILARVVAVLEQMFEIPREQITLDARLYDDLDIDSIDAVDLLVRLKPLLGQPLKPEQFRSVKTVRDVVLTVSRLVASPATTA